MSEDEVKPQSEEPTTETVKNEDVKEDGDVEEEEKEANGDKDEVDEDEEEEKTKSEDAEEMEEDVKEEKPKPKSEVKPEKKKVVEEAVKGEKSVPLYDQPLEMSGKRDRKKVERFIQEEKKEELKFDGSGTAFGDIPFIDTMIMTTHQDELKVLHRVAYSRPGKGAEIKKNLRQFNGFSFTKEDKKYDAKVLNVEKIVMSELKKMLNILGLERAGNKREVVERLMDFMLNPQDMGKKPPKIKKTKGRGRPKKGQEKSKNESAESVSGGDDSEGSSSGGEEEDDDNEDEENEEEDKPKKTPAKKTPAKKTPAKKTPGRKTPATTKKEKAPVKRPAPVKKAEKSSGSEISSDSESDDEPLAKKVKQPPSDGEIKAMVKKILDGANLEEVTMKSVCRQVFDSYPDFDLSHKKDFIKETVKSIIS